VGIKRQGEKGPTIALRASTLHFARRAISCFSCNQPVLQAGNPLVLFPLDEGQRLIGAVAA
jgi:hypothetical protein